MVGRRHDCTKAIAAWPGLEADPSLPSRVQLEWQACRIFKCVLVVLKYLRLPEFVTDKSWQWSIVHGLGLAENGFQTILEDLASPINACLSRFGTAADGVGNFDIAHVLIDE